MWLGRLLFPLGCPYTVCPGKLGHLSTALHYGIREVTQDVGHSLKISKYIRLESSLNDDLKEGFYNLSSHMDLSIALSSFIFVLFLIFEGKSSFHTCTPRKASFIFSFCCHLYFTWMFFSLHTSVSVIFYSVCNFTRVFCDFGTAVFNRPVRSMRFHMIKEIWHEFPPTVYKSSGGFKTVSIAVVKRDVTFSAFKMGRLHVDLNLIMVSCKSVTSQNDQKDAFWKSYFPSKTWLNRYLLGHSLPCHR